MASDPLYYAWSGSYLRLYIYQCQEVPCLCPFLVYGSLAAATAVHLVSSYLQSPLSAWLCLFHDPKLPKDLCLFHEVYGFRGCLALI